MKFNQEEAVKAGQMGFQTGKHIGKLTAKKIIAGTGTKGIQFSLWPTSEQSIDYLTVYYEKADGKIIKGGHNIIMAMMGLLKLNEINIDNLGHEQAVNEFLGLEIGLVLQKVLYTKQDNTDGYKFDIKMPFSARTGVTFKEAINKESALHIDEMVAALEDKDERNPVDMGAASNQGWGAQQPAPSNNFAPVDDF
ncbi:hypothetical protein PE36_00200 [Moritella sp. PE36]|uniref:hypothetical protein n=1 Tax=Moritella sp. PE36 TaxID=58051 RepID=UPI0001569289|nr:hypothetical protein [Moritella sp. PE36]EDM66171.1 hypothetical protein PE36_00200 [Moritella sp. PE36]